MRWLEQMNENIKRGIRSWLNVIPASPYNIQINELLDFETSAIRNRIWYRGDSNELEQLYREVRDCADQYKFWASKCTPGLEMRKVHTGLPGLIVRTLAARYGVTMPEDELLLKANQWELSHGGLTGRAAQQFIDYIVGTEEEKRK